MRTVCRIGSCLACSACMSICPCACVSFFGDDCGYTYTVVDEEACIECGRCVDICPVESPVAAHACVATYVGWAADEEVRRLSASGGVASALCSFVAQRGEWFSGAIFERDYSVRHVLSRDVSILERARNSKYVYSAMDALFNDVCNVLAGGERVLFVGLPCQVAAVRSYVGRGDRAKGLTTVDLVCHGVPPVEYLQQHIAKIDMAGEAGICSFRDPAFDTSRHVFSLRKSDAEATLVYAEDVRIDLYQVGYHNGLIYRENCYECPFAHRERVGDITLGDYHGLGKDAPYNGSRKQVSAVLVNTEKGNLLIGDAVAAGYLRMAIRPIEEPLRYDPQFNHPAVPGRQRAAFLAEYARTQCYDIAARKAFSSILRLNRMKKTLRVKEAREFVMAAIPRSIKEVLKDIKRKVIP